MRRSKLVQPSGFDISSALDTFLDERAYHGSGLTESNYRFNLKPLRAFFEQRGITLLEEVTPEVMRQYLKEQRSATYTLKAPKGQIPIPRSLSTSTLQQRYAIASAFFTWCERDGRLEESPMAKVARPKGEVLARQAFTPAEAKRLLQASKEAPGNLAIRDYALLRTFLSTGARVSEVAGMRWTDINWAEGVILVYGKGRKERRVKMSNDLRRDIQRWQDVCPRITGEWVWVTLRRTQMNRKAMYMWFRNLGGYAGVEHTHPHRLRHTFAAEFQRENRDIYATKTRLGHTKVATTEIYLQSLGVDYGMDESYRDPSAWLK